MILVEFWRSEGFAQMSGGDVRVVLGPFEGVQLTYNELRRTDTGEPIARFGDWIEGCESGWVADGVEFSDVSIYPAEVTA